VLIDAAPADVAGVAATIRMADGGESRVTMELPSPPGQGWMDALLPMALPVAMRLGEPLSVESPVSPRLLRAADTIQDILACWGALEGMELGAPPLFRRVPLTAQAAVPAPPAAGGTACFFTAGVDSFYSALKHRDELTALVYVRGFDVPFEDAALSETVMEGVRAAAASLGLPLVEVASDVRAFSDPLVPWEDYHGAALASVALLLSGRFRRVYLPATMTYATLLPLGSHPMVDPLWSSEHVEIAHDGAEATRRQKVAAIAGCEAARRWLRVCWENRGGAYNCGRCEKCVRTLVELRLAGVADRFESFPDLRLDDVAAVPLEYGGMGWYTALQSAEQNGRDPDLTEALRTALRRQRLVAAQRDDGPRRISDPRHDRLRLLALATETAVERDRLLAQVSELERAAAAHGRSRHPRDSRPWRAATRTWRSAERRIARQGPGP